MSADSGPGTREVAYRLFAAEFEDSTVSYSESDEERAPNYVVTPTGGRVNRVFLVGVLTETERVGGEQLRGRVVDPTGAFVAYAGQYQPDELAFLDRVEPPAFLAVTGKARTFSPEDSDRVYTSVRPESISEVDAATRDRWVVRTAEQTLDRVATMASALRSDRRGEALEERLAEEGVDPALASGVALAVEHYGTSSAYLQALRRTALDAVRVVAGERDEVDRLDLAPGEGGTEDAVLAGLAGMDLDETTPGPGIAAEEPAAGAGTDATDASATEPAASTEPTGGSTEATDAGAGSGSAGTTEGTEPEPEPEPTTEPAETATEPGAVGETTTATPAAESGSEVAEADAESVGTGAGGGATEPDGPVDGPEPVGTAEAAPGPDEEEFGEFEPGEFDLPDEEREEIEEEFGTDFETAGEVGPAGEADIETPGTGTEATPEASEGSTTEPGSGTPEPAAEPEPATEPEPEPASIGSTAEEATTGGDAEGAPGAGAEAEVGAATEAPDGDVDVDEVTVEVIAELDEGDGADREAVVSTVAERHGVDPDAVADAIEDAMMSGRAYEPSDGRLKAI